MISTILKVWFWHMVLCKGLWYLVNMVILCIWLRFELIFVSRSYLDDEIDETS
jgi:hypothetical protein